MHNVYICIPQNNYHDFIGAGLSGFWFDGKKNKDVLEYDPDQRKLVKLEKNHYTLVVSQKKVLL
jgi:hypothetical protein